MLKAIGRPALLLAQAATRPMVYVISIWKATK
jgi:hypothetical protein